MNMFTNLDQAAWALAYELNLYAVNSINCGEPTPIKHGHSIHEKCRSYERVHPEPHKPRAEFRVLWKELLELSQAKDPRAFRVADKLQAWLEARHPDDEEEPPPEDGPGPNRCVFWVKGQGHSLSALQWTLFSYVWPRKRVWVADLCEAVWGDERKHEALKQMLKAINAKFVKAKAPWTLSRERPAPGHRGSSGCFRRT